MIALAATALAASSGGSSSTDPNDLKGLPNPKVEPGQLNNLQSDMYTLKKIDLLERVFKNDPVAYTELSTGKLTLAREFAADATKSVYDIQQLLVTDFQTGAFQNAFSQMTWFDQLFLTDPTKINVLLYIVH